MEYTAKEFLLAKKIVRLQEALNQANRNAIKNGMLGVLAENEHTHVTYREKNTFYANVRKVLRETY